MADELHAGGLSAAEANRLFYADYADRYETMEPCAFDDRAQGLMRRVLTRAIAAAPSGNLRVLDACGGAGNASFMLISELGVQSTTVADVSAEMLARCQARASLEGYEISTVNAEVGDYLNDQRDGLDFVVFSSALHHLDDYEEVALRAYSKLAPSGVLVSVFDPVKVGRVGFWIRRIDWLLGLLLRTPSEFLRVLKSRLERVGSAPEDAIGRKAELHALTGIDDARLRTALESAGGEVIEHSRYADFRLRPLAWIADRLDCASAFHLIVRRP